MKVGAKKAAVLIYGPPGSGKGTQAELLVKHFGFFHLDTGAYLRKIIYGPNLQKNKIIQQEKKLNEEGKLQTPSFVLKVISRRTKELIKLGQNVVFSGSPRTLYEAFGTKKVKGLINVIKDSYGKKNIFIFVLKIPEEFSLQRNSKRMSCTLCGSPILGITGPKFKNCPVCGFKLVRRIDDSIEVIKDRLQEYNHRTKPIFDEMKKRGYLVVEINGRPLPYAVHKKIISHLPRWLA